MDDRKLILEQPLLSDLDCHEVWLLGQPPLQAYLDFVEEEVIGGEKMSRSRLVDEWRAANDYYATLEKSEAGIADKIGLRRLKAAMQPLVKKVRDDARFQKAFDILPAEFMMVELDKLVVAQHHISQHHVARTTASLGPTPDPKALFEFCLPLERVEAHVSIQKTGPGTFVFSSPSSDFRFLETRLLTPELLNSVRSFGPLGGVVGAMVGYGSNFLSAIRSEQRVLLHNGYHRAYALRSLGITHAPCIVQTVTRLDELKIIAGRTVTEDPAFFFKASRPPILKDFFDPNIRRVYPVHKLINSVEVSVEIKEMRRIRVAS